MKNELLDLEHLIKVTLNPARLTAKNLDEDFLLQNKEFAALEQERIKKRFDEVAVVPGNQTCLGIYFQKHQAGLLALSDKIYSYLQEGDLDSLCNQSNETAIKELYRFATSVPETLLDFIEHTFPSYFDRSMLISNARRAKERKGITHYLKRIRKEVKGSDIPDELVAILCAPFENLLLPGKTVSYDELYHLIAFRRGIHAFCAYNKIQTTKQLCALLIFLNYNSLRLLNYLTKAHQEAAKTYTSIPDIILYYYLQLKEINQHPVKPGIVFKPALPSMKEQIATWLYNEIHFYEKQWQMQGNKTGTSAVTQEKLNISLSVAELAFFIKLLQRARVIKSENSTELMNFIANNLRTDKSESISAGSLRNKYYNVESSTVESMKGVINDLVKVMKEY